MSRAKRPQEATPNARTTQICRYCKESQHVVFDTDFDGNMVESLQCGCAKKRRDGLCIDCSVPVKGRRWRCNRCRIMAPVKAAIRREQAERRKEEMLEADAELGFHTGYFVGGRGQRHE